MPVLSIAASLPEPPPVRLLVLGAPVLEHRTGRLPFAAERRFQLLALLAHETDWISRERLATLLWPQATPERSRRNLRKVLFGLREWHQLFALDIQSREGALRWAVQTDLQDFEAALARGDLATAVELWRGEPWDGIDGSDAAGFDDWLNYERQRLRANWRDALLRLCESEPDPARQSSWADRLLAHDPLDEEAVQVKMRACAQAGRSAAAARVYHPFAQALAEAVGIEPSARTRALLDSVVEPASQAGAGADRPAAPGPVDADFTGRLVEQRELAALLARPDCRWVSLLGPGGVGKTRFLNHALPALAPAFPGGAVYVPLDELDHAEQVLPRLAQRLALRLDGAQAPLLQLQRALQGRRLLLALDNLEHVRTVAPLLGELLQACPELRLIATSRERADVAGEWCLALEGLPYPEPDDVDRAEAFDAVQLFVRRAQASQPRFDLQRERIHVAELCALVEGMPLALELAAAWTRHFSVEEIVRDLKAGGAMLIEPQLGRTRRQQSMALTFEHSWGLLVAAERDALMRMSVFAGTFTREAAQWVAGASLGVLMALIDKSLLRKDAFGATPRFGFHPLLHQFLKARLEQRPDVLEEAQRRHADFYCRLLARYQGGQPPKAWTAQADAETENILDAWNHAVQHGLTPLLSGALMGFVSHAYRIGHWKRDLAAIDAAEALHADSPYERSRLCTYRAVLQLNLGLDRDAARSTQEALRVLRRAQDRRTLQACLFYQGMARVNLGEFDAAESCLRESLEVAEADGNAVGIQASLSGLVDTMRAVGRYDDAIQMAQSADIDEEWWTGNVADFHRLAGRPAQALRLLAPALDEPAPSSHDSYLLECRWMVLQTAAAAHLDLGDLERARHHSELALAVQRDLGRGDIPIVTLPTCLLRSRLAWLQGDLGAARRLLAEASAVASQQRSHQHLVRVAVHWARMLTALGEQEHAAQIVRVALAEPTTGAETRAIALQLAAAGGWLGADGGAALERSAPLSTTEIVLLVRGADSLCSAALARAAA